MMTANKRLELTWKSFPEVPTQDDLPIAVCLEATPSEVDVYTYEVPTWIFWDRMQGGAVYWASIDIAPHKFAYRNSIQSPLDPLDSWPHVKAVREAVMAAQGSKSCDEYYRKFNDRFLEVEQ